MNILVIGNGFDLAHGLPTKYGDFLELCRMIKTIYDVDNKEDADQAWANLCLKVSNGIDKFRFVYHFIRNPRKRWCFQRFRNLGVGLFPCFFPYGEK